MKNLSNKEAIKYLCCPFDQSKLKTTKEALICSNCSRKFNITNKIIEFVDPKNLDKKTRRELKGNFYKLDKKTIETYATKDEWSSYHIHCSDKKFDLILKKLNQLKSTGIFSLGSGTGFEIKKILNKKKLEPVFSSDLSFTATMIVPYTLEKNSVKACLFTSDLNFPPVIPTKKMPILVYEAMHHTGDIHLTLDKLLERGYKDIILVEPTTNFLIRILAKFNLAERVEYSGEKPSLLDLAKVKKLIKKHKYEAEMVSLWEFPEDFFRKIFGQSIFMEKIFLKFMDGVSFIGNVFKIGSMSFVYLRKK